MDYLTCSSALQRAVLDHFFMILTVSLSFPSTVVSWFIEVECSFNTLYNLSFGQDINRVFIFGEF
jgi:hypothetical protein